MWLTSLKSRVEEKWTKPWDWRISCFIFLCNTIFFFLFVILPLYNKYVWYTLVVKHFYIIFLGLIFIILDVFRTESYNPPFVLSFSAISSRDDSTYLKLRSMITVLDILFPHAQVVLENCMRVKLLYVYML